MCGTCTARLNNAGYVRKYAAQRKDKLRADRAVVLGMSEEDMALANEAEIEFEIATWRANAMEHTMGPTLADDGPGTFIAVCERCHGFLVGDPCEAPPFYGRAYDTECPGAPPVRPAKRRDPMQEAASSTSLAHEPVSTELSGLPYMLGKPWTWEMPAVEPGWEAYPPK